MNGWIRAIAGAVACISVTAIVLPFAPECQHWYVIPVTLCGMFVMPDALRWFTRECDPFDVYGALGLFSIVFFYFIPLACVPMGVELAHIDDQPSDYRTWIGVMAGLNLAGLAIFYLTRWLTDLMPTRHGVVWQVSAQRFYFSAFMILTACLSLQLLFWLRVGGIGAVVRKEANLAGMGILFLFSEAFPYMLFFVVLIHYRIRNRRMPVVSLICLFLFCVCLLFLFGGLRGSRSNFLNGLIVMVILVHWTQFRIRKSWIVIGLVPLFFFLTVYGLYKSLRADITSINSYASYVEASETTNRTWKTVIFGDVGRTNLQSYTFRKLVTQNEYEYAYGSTYVGASFLMLPKVLRPDLRTGTIAGTDLLYGMGSYTGTGSGEVRSTRIFGLAGEAMLNFGLWSVPVVFGIAGFVVARSRQYFMSMHPLDMRILIYPFALRILATIWHLDMANIVFAVVKNGALPMLFVLLVSDRVRLPFMWEQVEGQ